ncbi:MAG: SDR family oxidoreductase [Marinobacterium sp.]|nr:SDR family oxidoreductase [Marinobacterium sp.]
MENLILITGGGRGIGAQTARLAAERGYRVCISYRENIAAADRLLRELRAGGYSADAFCCDVSCEAQVLALFQWLDHFPGRLAALVNNAGLLETQMRLDQMDVGRLHRVMNTNVIGSFLCAREAVRRMSTLHGGSGGAIVNLSSAAARLGAPDEYIDYAASKGAIDSMTLGLSKEVAAEGIRVNAVRPGLINTDIHASGGEPGRVGRLASSVPMQRGGEAVEVAQSILWLLSDEASYVNGALLDVTGGR